MSVDISILKELPGPLSNVGAQILTQLAELGTAEAHRPGALILAVDAGAARFHIVTAGRLRVGLSMHGRAPLTLQTLLPGEMAGLSWMWPPHRWQWDVTAVDESSTVSFDVHAVLDTCDRDLSFRAAMLELVAYELRDRLSHARLQLLDIYGPST